MLGQDSFTDFLNGYIEALVWSSSDDEISNFEYELSEMAVRECKRDCFDFYETWAWVIHATGDHPSKDWAYVGDTKGHSLAALAGHDFALTRNGHGVGFWETGRWREGAGYQLDNAATKFGEAELYVGDDDLLHIC